LNNIPKHEALGNNPHKLRSYSPEPIEVYCFGLKIGLFSREHHVIPNENFTYNLLDGKGTN